MRHKILPYLCYHAGSSEIAVKVNYDLERQINIAGWTFFFFFFFFKLTCGGHVVVFSVARSICGVADHATIQKCTSDNANLPVTFTHGRFFTKYRRCGTRSDIEAGNWEIGIGNLLHPTLKRSVPTASAARFWQSCTCCTDWHPRLSLPSAALHRTGTWSARLVWPNAPANLVVESPRYVERSAKSERSSFTTEDVQSKIGTTVVPSSVESYQSDQSGVGSRPASSRRVHNEHREHRGGPVYTCEQSG